MTRPEAEYNVKRLVKEYLLVDLPNNEEWTVEIGEISHPGWGNYTADVVVYQRGSPVIAIETKRNSNFRKALGQAAVYSLTTPLVGIAGYDVPDVIRMTVSKLGMVGFDTEDHSTFGAKYKLHSIFQR